MNGKKRCFTTYSSFWFHRISAGSGVDTYYLGPPEELPAEASQTTTDVPVHNLDFDIDCADCHNSHGEFLPHDAGQKVVCETCHNPSGKASDKLEFALHLTPNKNPAVDYVDCGSCHELHNPGGANTTESISLTDGTPGVNKSFLRANVEKYVPTAIPGAGSLQNDTYDAADPLSALTPERAVEGGDDSTARGYCQVCHTLTNYHRSSNTAGADQCHDGETGNCGPSETNCGRCHQHNNKFIGVGGTQTCMECHASAQGARPIITTQFTRLSHHVPGTLDEIDCEVCHDQGGHQSGKVTLWDTDNHAQPSFQQPTTAATLASGEGEAFAGHCLSCHDADGAADETAPLSPFNGSGAPPIIDSTAWTSAGHNRDLVTFPSSPVTCVGDGTNGCHGSGHGSEKLTLLAPAATGPTAPEDFCFVCHDAGGPSSLDINAQFNSATNYQTTGAGGALLNQRHDIFPADQAYSGGSVTCKDCHSPHIDNSSSPVSDVDTGNPLPDYDYLNGTYNGGGNLDPINPEGSAGGFTEPDNIQFCLACHDGSAPAGVTMSSGMVNLGTSYSGKQHGTGEGSSGSRTGKGNLKVPWTTQSDFDAGNDPTDPYAALNCTTCHGAHGSDNIFNLRSSITVAGVQMSVGGKDSDSEFFGISGTTYTLPVNGGSQNQQEYGAWCTFCHEMNAHAGVDETTTCQSGHQHGNSAF